MIWYGMNMAGSYRLKIKISINMPTWQKHRLSMHKTIKTGNMAIKCMQLDAYIQNTSLNRQMTTLNDG